MLVQTTQPILIHVLAIISSLWKLKHVCIARLALQEINRTGARFTWSNRQRDPIRSVLDRFFVSPDWEQAFPLVSLCAETPIGSDHTPLVLDTGEATPARSPRFFFETAWLSAPGFKELVIGKWLDSADRFSSCRGPTEFWNAQSSSLRQFLRGWGANKGNEDKIHKQNILGQIQALDQAEDLQGLDEEGWAFRYHLEEQLMHHIAAEEEYWRQRGRQNWLLKGDVNTAFFHAYANGRKRKCAIFRLDTPQGVISNHYTTAPHSLLTWVGKSHICQQTVGRE